MFIQDISATVYTVQLFSVPGTIFCVIKINIVSEMKGSILDIF